MSLSSYDYIGFRLKHTAIQNTDLDPKRAVFQRLLRLVGAAMHEIERVDLGDNEPGSEHEAIDQVLQFLTPDLDLIERAQAFEVLRNMLTSYFDILGEPQERTQITVIKEQE